MQDLKKIEKLNNLFFALTSRGKSAGAEGETKLSVTSCQHYQFAAVEPYVECALLADLDLEMPEAQITQATVAGGQTGRKNRRRG